MNNTNFSVVDVFCGVGGLTHGFILEGFNVVAGIDSDISCKYAFEKNNNSKFICADLNKLDSFSIDNEFTKNNIKILVGCAPCQDFSIYNNKNQSGRHKLLSRFAKIINEIQPDIVSMENVPNLMNHEGGKTFEIFKNNLREIYGDNIYCEIVNAKDYGVPQRRKRIVLLASKKGKINLITPDEFKKSGLTFFSNVREAISNLPKISDGEICSTDALHRARKLSEINKKRIIATKEGGSWKEWPEELILDCHKKEGGKTFGSVYGRMKWDDVSPTMTTYCIGLGNGRFGHPEQDRAISLREASIFQSFPPDYDFIGTENQLPISTIARQIGNAVPVNLGRAIAQSIKKHLTKFSNE